MYMLDLRYLFQDREWKKTMPRQTAFSFLSGGKKLYGRCLLPGRDGEETPPTILMLHGFPGHEQNRDLAQALRRAGFAVILFSYRGNWGSGGTYCLSHLGEDAAAALAYVRSQAGAWGIDARRVFTVGHSMGGFTTMQLLAAGECTHGSVLMAPCDMEAMYVHAPEDFDSLIQSASVYVRLDEEGTNRFARVCEEHRRDWEFPQLAEKMDRRIPLLLVGAANDTVTPPHFHIAPLREAVQGMGIEATSNEFDDIHTFDASRIRLTETVALWLREHL